MGPGSYVAEVLYSIALPLCMQWPRHLQQYVGDLLLLWAMVRPDMFHDTATTGVVFGLVFGLVGIGSGVFGLVDAGFVVFGPIDSGLVGCRLSVFGLAVFGLVVCGSTEFRFIGGNNAPASFRDIC